MDLLERRWFFEGMINRITLLLFIGLAFSQLSIEGKRISINRSFGFQSEKTPVSLFDASLLFRLNEHSEIFTGFGTIIFGSSLFTGYKHYLNDFSKPSPYMSISYHGGVYYDTGAELTGIFPSLGFSLPISKNSFLNFGIGYVFMQKNTMNDFRGKKGFVAPFLNYEMLK